LHAALGVARAASLGISALVVVDREGYEKGLFDDEMGRLLAKHSPIIEYTILSVWTSARICAPLFLKHFACNRLEAQTITKKRTPYRYERLRKYDTQ
jgi:hypothetical protein